MNIHFVFNKTKTLSFNFIYLYVQSLDDLISELEEVRVSLRQERSQLLQRIEKQREEFSEEKREIVKSINEIRSKQQQLKKP